MNFNEGEQVKCYTAMLETFSCLDHQRGAEKLAV